jgi:hypothetical protein
MSDDEVTAMSGRADVAAVRAYRSAVGRRTREIVQGLSVGAWDEIVRDEDISRAGRGRSSWPAQHCATTPRTSAKPSP